ncbi:ABC transporter substrate-binding protein [Marinithermus hydrothermalis]|uniref:ABC-type glycine betaine transport, periplasmic subunit n=1 Tax=Marinithermus hydrothermalis (strain DSM 14884 / JCM 11576 / T1) TaxID=869210 RepID=F2NKQ6_MARHT|nr:ABC transporter substrate-binding protein [Marinithermus hydrothermalis]AEB10819.1 ABC-type glycine betaine transport, periplasmic subunit [Marinithermus hydrothermalis DSM 14884]
MKRVQLGLIALALTLGVAFAQVPECELDRPVVFAGLDWDSARIHNAIAAYILEHGYGCQTDSIPGSTIPLVQGLIRGDLDVMMEVWVDNIKETWDKALATGRVVDLGVNFPDAIQGWFVPRYVIEGDPERGIAPMAPDLRSVQDLPRYKTLFTDPESPDKGRFYNCILGWACEVINTKKLEAYGLSDDYTNFRPGTGAALAAAIASAYERGKPILAYYWGPTWVLGKYDLVMLEEPPFTQECWDELNSERRPQTACAYPVIKVTVGVSKDFADQAPTLVEFLKRYETSNQLVSELLAFMQDNDAEVEEAAIHFLKNYTDVWTQWVPAEVAARVQASLP